MDDDWTELTEIEVRVTATDRLDLHFEHRDALEVERGSWSLCEYLSRHATVEAEIAGLTLHGPVLTVGGDWFQLPTSLVRAQACTAIRTGQRAAHRAPTSPLEFRQALRHLAGRIPREVVLVGGRSMIVQVEWVAGDFAHIRSQSRTELLPLAQIAAVLGRVEIPGG
jgi:hypothetical protein